ncbi:hypothetical protein KKD70_04320 [Patescibacteria group bacterium]|nr:hypothetical protein [Patescibacteria group bacterium]
MSDEHIESTHKEAELILSELTRELVDSKPDEDPAKREKIRETILTVHCRAIDVMKKKPAKV